MVQSSGKWALAVVDHCMIVAALDNNHNGDLHIARQLIDIAVEAGCDAVKLQRREAEWGGVRSVLDQPLRKFPRLGRTWREVWRQLQFTDEVFSSLLKYTEGRIDVMVAPYDLPSLQSLDSLQVKAIKIDPPVAVHAPLLTEVSKGRRPVIVSIGTCTHREVLDVIGIFASCDLTLMHTLYARSFEASLRDLYFLRPLSSLGRPLGYSDDQPGMSLAFVARAFGVRVIEKRLTLDRTSEGPDHQRSLTPDELVRLVAEIRRAEAVMAGEVERIVGAEAAEIFDQDRPSIVAAMDLEKGTILTAGMLAVKPPARGLSPKFLPRLVGKRLLYDLGADDFITFGMVEP